MTYILTSSGSSIYFHPKYGNTFYSALNMKNTPINQRITRFIRMSEKLSGEILADMTDQIYKSVTASGTYEMMIICPLLVSFEDEDSEKKLSTQIIDYKNAFEYFVTNSPYKDKLFVYPFLGFDKIYYNNAVFNKTIDFISSYIKKPGVIQNGESCEGGDCCFFRSMPSAISLATLLASIS